MINSPNPSSSSVYLSPKSSASTEPHESLPGSFNLRAMSPDEDFFDLHERDALLTHHSPPAYFRSPTSILLKESDPFIVPDGIVYADERILFACKASRSKMMYFFFMLDIIILFSCALLGFGLFCIFTDQSDGEGMNRKLTYSLKHLLGITSDLPDWAGPFLSLFIVQIFVFIVIYVKVWKYQNMRYLLTDQRIIVFTKSEKSCSCFRWTNTQYRILRYCFYENVCEARISPWSWRSFVVKRFASSDGIDLGLPQDEEDIAFPFIDDRKCFICVDVVRTQMLPHPSITL
eukprot:TRINITY_DN19068_c0_g1::TRINITY_DN19068_c0_g1_i1::g.13855::m.13855 TRINITY_DN19068_c0_g1::TRINITY_DN19068_c0_g1_i1::g.13855  ORF type:complete len:289 (+),score=3.42,Tetraspannin/PF00335.15/0.00046,DUF3671/PF12420.3/1.8 TRINITY_DN19068_c0_g1_i1:2-868(+)